AMRSLNVFEQIGANHLPNEENRVSLSMCLILFSELWTGTTCHFIVKDFFMLGLRKDRRL
ncbi:hypothetical protein O9H85_33105, partial [Paenibacillus filicis]